MSADRPPRSPAAIPIDSLPYALDPPDQLRAAIGIVALDGDSTIEHELRGLLDIKGVAFYVSRLAAPTQMSLQALGKMEAGISGATALLVPGQRLDVVAFGCTSAPVLFGEERVFEQIHTARPEVRCTTPITAALAGFRSLGVRRITVITPYPRELNELMYAYLVRNDLEIVSFGSFDEKDANCAGRIDLESIRRSVVAAGANPAVEAVFVSCTSLRLREIVVQVENAIGKPVTSSDHALAWHCLRLAGVHDPVPEAGRLFGESPGQARRIDSPGAPAIAIER